MNRATKLFHLVMWNPQIPYQKRIEILTKLKEGLSL